MRMPAPCEHDRIARHASVYQVIQDMLRNELPAIAIVTQRRPLPITNLKRFQNSNHNMTPSHSPNSTALQAPPHRSTLTPKPSQRPKYLSTKPSHPSINAVQAAETPRSTLQSPHPNTPSPNDLHILCPHPQRTKQTTTTSLFCLRCRLLLRAPSPANIQFKMICALSFFERGKSSVS